MAKVSSKFASWAAKKIKEATKDKDYVKGDPRMTKRNVKESVAAAEMTKMSRAELEELAKKSRSIRGQAAIEELDRRILKTYLKKTGKLKDDRENPVYDTSTGARLSDPLSASDVRKEIEKRNAEAKAKGFNRGGMPARKSTVRK